MHQLSPDFAATLPANPTDTPERRAEKIASAQRQFEAFYAADEAEAALAAFAVTTLQGAMDNMERAARPGMGAETAARLRGNALAAGRFYASTLGKMQKRQRQDADAEARAAKAPSAAAEDEKPIGFPRIELFNPRDRRGNIIPAWRHELLTTKQKRAAYDYANKAAWAEAIAEEDAAIAEQADLDARSPPTEEELRYYLPLTATTDPGPATPPASA
jgi:hypothetical protein